MLTRRLSCEHDLLAEIGLDHARLFRDLARCPLGNLLAVVEHHDAVHAAPARRHAVLDPDDRAAELAPDPLAHLGRGGDLRGAEAAWASACQYEPRARR